MTTCSKTYGSSLLPLHLLVEDYAIGGILCRERGATILHAEHQQWLGAVVADGTLAIRGHSHHASLGYREHLAINLELALAAEEEIQLLMVLVGVDEAGLRARSERLEGELATCRAYQCATKHLSGDFHLR